MSEAWNRIDMTGWVMKEHGVPDSLLTVIEPAPKRDGDNKTMYWRCRCECGRECIVRGYLVRSGMSRSCGCLGTRPNQDVELDAKRVKAKLHNVFRAMHNRCENSNDQRYHRYGARGVKVCDEWSTFQSFYNWALSNGYAEGLTIDRIENDKDYTPDNCRWVSNEVQARNKEDTVRVEVNGESHTLEEWATITGMKRATLANRYYSGWDADRIVKTPKLHNGGHPPKNK